MEIQHDNRASATYLSLQAVYGRKEGRKKGRKEGKETLKRLWKSKDYIWRKTSRTSTEEK
jgi:hypothetical protein